METPQSKIILEEIEERNGMFWVKFTYEIAGRKFPIENSCKKISEIISLYAK